MSGEYEQTTEFLQTIASRALSEAQNTRGMLWNTMPQQVPERSLQHSLTKPNFGARPLFSDVFAAGDSTDPEIMRLNGEADGWMEKYFPAMNGGLKTLPDDMLIGIISGVKPYGLDKTVLEIAWHQARDRAYRASNTEQRTLEARFSSAGFSLPPGALVAAIIDSDQRASQAIAEVNWQQAIKDADIKIELLKFAEEQAIRLKLGIMQQMGDFYRLWHSVPDRDIERARVRAQALASFHSSLASYNSVEMAFEELRFKVAAGKSSVQLESDGRRVGMAAASHTAGGLGQAAGAFGQIASGAASAASSLVARVEDV
jgi:hypothetical protein